MVPPEAETVAAPPLPHEEEVAEAVAVSTAGCVMVTVAEDVLGEASVTETE